MFNTTNTITIIIIIITEVCRQCSSYYLIKNNIYSRILKCYKSPCIIDILRLQSKYRSGDGTLDDLAENKSAKYKVNTTDQLVRKVL